MSTVSKSVCSRLDAAVLVTEMAFGETEIGVEARGEAHQIAVDLRCPGTEFRETPGHRPQLRSKRRRRHRWRGGKAKARGARRRETGIAEDRQLRLQVDHDFGLRGRSLDKGRHRIAKFESGTAGYDQSFHLVLQRTIGHALEALPVGLREISRRVESA